MPAKKEFRRQSTPGLDIRKTGSLRFYVPDGTGYFESKIAVRILTSAEILALSTTPIALIAAPGAGKVIIVDRIVGTSTFVTAAYTGANALEFRYTNASGAKVTADIAAAFINVASGTLTHTVGGLVAELVAVSNAAIVVRVPTADPAAGSGNIKLQIAYREVPV